MLIHIGVCWLILTVSRLCCQGCTSAEGNTSISITGSAKTLRSEIRDGKASTALIVSALLSRKQMNGFWLTERLSRAGTNPAHHLQCSQFLHFWHMPRSGFLKMGHDHSFKSSALISGALLRALHQCIGSFGPCSRHFAIFVPTACGRKKYNFCWGCEKSCT